MGFSFTDLADTLNPVGDVLKFGAGLYDMFRGHDSRSADAMYAMLGASVDPNSPQFKNLAALFEEQNRANAIKNMQMLMQQHARGKARGDAGYFVNPERRDEARSGALAQAFMNAGIQGRDEARRSLTGAAGGYAAGVPYDQYQDQLKSQYIGAAGESLGDLFKSLRGSQLYGSYPEQYGDRTIYWDRPRTEF